MKTLLFVILTATASAGPLEDYEKGLARLQEQYDKAIANGGEKSKLDAVLEKEKAKLKETLEAAGSEATARTMEVDSKKKEGTRIGSFLTGETITIEYVEGQWVAYPGWKHESPDEAKIPQHRIALYHRKAGGEETIVDFPKESKGNPWKFLVEKPGNYYLRIADPAIDANEGKVTYKVGVIKPEK